MPPKGQFGSFNPGTTNFQPTATYGSPPSTGRGRAGRGVPGAAPGRGIGRGVPTMDRGRGRGGFKPGMGALDRASALLSKAKEQGGRGSLVGTGLGRSTDFSTTKFGGDEKTLGKSMPEFRMPATSVSTLKAKNAYGVLDSDDDEDSSIHSSDISLSSDTSTPGRPKRDVLKIRPEKAIEDFSLTSDGEKSGEDIEISADLAIDSKKKKNALSKSKPSVKYATSTKAKASNNSAKPAPSKSVAKQAKGRDSPEPAPVSLEPAAAKFGNVMRASDFFDEDSDYVDSMDDVSITEESESHATSLSEEISQVISEHVGRDLESRAETVTEISEPKDRYGSIQFASELSSSTSSGEERFQAEGERHSGPSRASQANNASRTPRGWKSPSPSPVPSVSEVSDVASELSQDEDGSLSTLSPPGSANLSFMNEKAALADAEIPGSISDTEYSEDWGSASALSTARGGRLSSLGGGGQVTGGVQHGNTHSTPHRSHGKSHPSRRGSLLSPRTERYVHGRSVHSRPQSPRGHPAGAYAEDESVETGRYSPTEPSRTRRNVGVEMAVQTEMSSVGGGIPFMGPWGNAGVTGMGAPPPGAYPGMGLAMGSSLNPLACSLQGSMAYASGAWPGMAVPPVWNSMPSLGLGAMPVSPYGAAVGPFTASLQASLASLPPWAAYAAGLREGSAYASGVRQGQVVSEDALGIPTATENMTAAEQQRSGAPAATNTQDPDLPRTESHSNPPPRPTTPGATLSHAPRSSPSPSPSLPSPSPVDSFPLQPSQSPVEDSSSGTPTHSTSADLTPAGDTAGDSDCPPPGRAGEGAEGESVFEEDPMEPLAAPERSVSPPLDQGRSAAPPLAPGVGDYSAGYHGGPGMGGSRQVYAETVERAVPSKRTGFEQAPAPAPAPGPRREAWGEHQVPSGATDVPMPSVVCAAQMGDLRALEAMFQSHSKALADRLAVLRAQHDIRQHTLMTPFASATCASSAVNGRRGYAYTTLDDTKRYMYEKSKEMTPMFQPSAIHNLENSNPAAYPIPAHPTRSPHTRFDVHPHHSNLGGSHHSATPIPSNHHSTMPLNYDAERCSRPSSHQAQHPPPHSHTHTPHTEAAPLGQHSQLPHKLPPRSTEHTQPQSVLDQKNIPRQDEPLRYHPSTSHPRI